MSARGIADYSVLLVDINYKCKEKCIGLICPISTIVHRTGILTPIRVRYMRF